MNIVKSACVLFLLVALSSWTTHGAGPNPPDLMTYQGYLVDGNGAALGASAPKNYDVIFRIYDSQTGGSIQWSEQQTITVDKGYFSVLLGEGSAVGSEVRPALGTVFSGASASDRFIGVTVKGIGPNNGSVDILPRMQMVTAPYAFAAQTASSLPNGAGITGRNVLEFGQGVVGKEPNAGKIGYQTFSLDSLDLVGAGTGSNRKISMWAEGGLTLHGDMILGQAANDYHQLRLGGGNSFGYLYGSFPGLADGIHLGYNAYYDAGGNPHIDNPGAGSSLISAGYGWIKLFVSDVNAMPTTKRLEANMSGVAVSGRLEVGGSTHVAGAIQARGGAPGPNGANENGYAFGGGGGGDNDSGMFSTADGLLQFFNNANETVRISPDGNVGIGTTSPAFPLSFPNTLGDKISLWGQENRHYGFGIQGSLLQIMTDSSNADVAFGSGPSAGFTETVRIKGNGRVGIGTPSPGAPLHVAASPISVGLYDSPDGFSNDSGFNGAWGLGTVNGGNFLVSILANGWVAGWGMVANSDSRIKEIIGVSDGERDLKSLSSLKVTDYKMVDKVGEGAGVRKGFIAQEVRSLFPEAVGFRQDFIPDIYAKAASIEFSADGHELSLKVPKDHGLIKGNVVRLYADNNKYEVSVTAVSSSTSFVVNFDGSELKQTPKSVFVYGKQVDDFLSVNYDHIFTVGISAMQELAKKVDALNESQARIAELEQKAKRVDELERNLSALQETVAKLAIATGQKQLASGRDLENGTGALGR